MYRRDALKAIPAICLAPTALTAVKTPTIIHEYVVVHDTKTKECSVNYTRRELESDTHFVLQSIDSNNNRKANVFYSLKNTTGFKNKVELREAVDDFIKIMGLKVTSDT